MLPKTVRLESNAEQRVVRMSLERIDKIGISGLIRWPARLFPSTVQPKMPHAELIAVHFNVSATDVIVAGIWGKLDMAICPHDCGRLHITLDIDLPFGTHRFGNKFDDYHTRKSPGGNTHYIFCWNTRNVLSADTIFRIREMLHDDTERVDADKARFLATGDMRFAEGVLFDSRNGSDAGEWIDGYTK